jgi:DNA-binding IclR family transcriptional regulator
MTRKTDYTNDAQQRLIKVIFALFSDVVSGLSPAMVAKACDSQPSTVTRDLDNLLTAGVVEKDEASGHWRLTPRLPQQALKALASIERASKRVDESRQRYSRNPD